MPKPMLNKSSKSVSNIPISWQQQLSQAITEPELLFQALKLKPEDFDNSTNAHRQFSLKVPLAYIDKMQQGNPRDPLLLQVLTQAQEMQDIAGYGTDPVGDLAANKTPGLLHKYHGRVLLITTAACAIHCRYCFRRHFPYQTQQAGRDQWQQSLQYIQQDNNIKEVILSGGDPLLLSDEKLDSLISRLESISHISRLRIHSRLPVVLPGRITDALVQRLASSRFNICLVIHANHANEITLTEVKVLKKLQLAGIQLLNQAVLLKGINEQLDDQINLSEALYHAGVLPYYLHLLDAVQGAAHFDVNLNDALQLIRQMRARLPGFLVPELVREMPGEASKIPANEL